MLYKVNCLKLSTGFLGFERSLTMNPSYKRIGKKLGYLLAGMVIFLAVTMWLKGMEFKFRVFMAIFAGLSAWMGLITMVIWLWRDSTTEEEKEVPEKK
jgi:hypothetical protein